MIARIIFDINEVEMRKAVSRKVLRILQRTISKITKDVGDTFVKYVRGTEAWRSLTETGPMDLRSNLGLSNEIISTGLEDILQTWQKGFFTKVEDKSKGNNLEIIITIGAIRSDYSDVLNLPLSKYISVNNNRFSKRRGEATEIPWLQWLLLEAETIVVSGWTTLAVDGVNRRSSRSGTMIMRPSHSKNWTMPGPGRVSPPNKNFVEYIINSDVFQRDVLDIIINNTKINKL